MNQTKIIFSAALLIFSAAYCSGNPSNSQTEQSALQSISMSEFSDIVKKDPSIKVLDVRTPQEFAEGHVPGAKLFSLQDIQAQGASVSANLPFTKEDKIYIICKSGGRSMKATQMLTSLGYKDVTNVEGGTMGFIRMGNKVEN